MGQPAASSVTWPGPNRLICRVGAEPVGQPTEPARLFKNVLCDFQLKTLNALGQCHSRFPGKLKGFTRNSTFCVMAVEPNRWDISVSYRYLHSENIFIGYDEQPQYKAGGSNN